MKKSDLTANDCIHCETKKEFHRMIELFEINNEYLSWEIYEQTTILFPFEDAYGELTGYAVECNYNIISSKDIYSSKNEF